MSFGQDGAISPAGFESRYETELANEYGNLASRTLAMIGRYRDGTVPDAERRPGRWRRTSTGCASAVAELLDRAELTTALDEIWQRVRRLNRYVEERAPWQLAKDPDARRRARPELYSLAEGLRVLTVLLHPYLPATRPAAAGGARAIRARSAAAEFGARHGAAATTSRFEALFPKR